MMMKNQLAVRIGVCLLLLAAPAAAGTVFDNFPINGTVDAWTIDNIYSVSDSFTLTSPESLTGVNIGVWEVAGDTLTSVDWSLGTVFFGSDWGAGTASGASLTDAPQFTNGMNFSVDEVSFSLPNVGLTTGTYYLTLQNGITANGNPVYWDENGTSVNNGVIAQENQAGSIFAESFQILGSPLDPPPPVPEPATWALFGSGILVAAGLRRKLIRR
jgi:PEP-CTERM motif